MALAPASVSVAVGTGAWLPVFTDKSVDKPWFNVEK